MPFVCIGEQLADLGSGTGRVQVEKSFNLLDVPVVETGGLVQYPIAWEEIPDKQRGLGGVLQYRRGYVGELIFRHEGVARPVYEHVSVAFQLTLVGLHQRGLLKAGKKTEGGLIIPSGMRELQGARR